MAPAPEARSGKGVDFKHPGGKEFLIIGGVALAAGLLYFWWKGRQAANQAAASSSSGSGADSPTAILSAWFRDHAGSSPNTTVTVPNVIGLSDTAADAALKAVGLTSTSNEPSGGFGKDTATVSSQSPPAGTAVKPGSAVALTFHVKQPARKGSGGGGDHGEA